MTEDLQRRISDALSRPGGIAGDPELAAALEADPAARAYAQDLRRLDEALRARAGAARDEADWERLAAAIDGRLDEPLDDDGIDPLAAPTFLDEDAPEEHEVPPGAAGGAVVPFRPLRTPAPWILWTGALAAAAAVLIGIGVGTATLGPAAAPMAEIHGPLDEAPAAPEPEPSTAVGVVAPAASGAERAEPEQPEAEPPARPAPPAELARREAPSDRSADVPARDDAPLGGLLGPRDHLAGSGGARSAGAPGPEAPPPGRLARRARAVGEPPEAQAESEAEEASEPDEGETPSLEAAFAALRPQVRRCLSRQREPAQVRVVVGSGGRVERAEVLAPTADTRIRACVERQIAGLAGTALDEAPGTRTLSVDPPRAVLRSRPPSSRPAEDAPGGLDDL
ncbi:MAG: hypothetical protein ACFCGT_13505 [Sandaracinaceae bacterium]